MILSQKVQKYKVLDWKQERSLIITEKHIYSFNGRSKCLLGRL